MDLVTGVRKEGSRGGRGEFKWSEVQSSQHRENYLGHSVMAPVGRWQQGRDLQWYARDQNSDQNSEKVMEDNERLREIQEIKRAENEALSQALGFDPNFTAANKTIFASREPDCDSEDTSSKIQGRSLAQKQHLAHEAHHLKPRRRSERSETHDRSRRSHHEDREPDYSRHHRSSRRIYPETRQYERRRDSRSRSPIGRDRATHRPTRTRSPDRRQERASHHHRHRYSRLTDRDHDHNYDTQPRRR